MGKRFVTKLVIPVLLCLTGIFVELLAYSAIMSRYALRHWWSVGSLDTVTLHAIFLAVAVMSLVIGYRLGLIWPMVVAQLLLFCGRAAIMVAPDSLMFGLEFPVAVVSAWMFGWIGTKLRSA